MGARDRMTGKWEIEIDPKRDWLSKYWRKLFDADQYKTAFKPPRKHHLVFDDIDLVLAAQCEFETHMGFYACFVAYGFFCSLEHPATMLQF